MNNDSGERKEWGMKENKDAFDFPLKGTVTMEDVKKIQQKLLEMAVMLRDILERDDIPYTIIFGSLLGAVRHKGFIPWDLDFDFCIPEEVYEDALKRIESELPSDYAVLNRETDENYCACWSKIVDKKSEMVFDMYERDNTYKYRGVHVDLYKMKKTGANNYRYDLLTDNMEYYRLMYKRNLLQEKEYLSFIDPIQKELQALKCVEEEKDRYYFLNFLNTSATNIFPRRLYEFEGYEFYGPADYDAVLNDCYYKGDYMQLPPYEKRDTKIRGFKYYDSI